jgi:hypothetical protein
MAYTKTNWLPRIADNKNKYLASGAVPGEVFLVNTPDNITQPGTPFSVENMNKLEQGVFEAHEALDNMPFGYLVPFQFMPTALQLATWRCLPLQGQVVLISQYQRLCNAEYVGDAANATADWWYKCDSTGNRTTGGAYMRVLDHRGLFSRAAGQNSKYTMANDAPYDGGTTGDKIGDAIRELYGKAIFDKPGVAGLRVVGAEGVFFNNAISQYTANPEISGAIGQGIGTLVFRASNVVPAALENRPASISVYVCIKY